MISHKQLTVSNREKIAKYAKKYGINNAAIKFDVKYETAKKWYAKYKNCESLTNEMAKPLTMTDFEHLDTFKEYVGQVPLKTIINKFKLPFTVDTLSRYYRTQNIPGKIKYLRILKCPQCQHSIRLINVFWGQPKSIPCPFCHSKYLVRQELLKIPFYNPRGVDYFLDNGKLKTIKTNNFKHIVLPKLLVPDDLRCLFVYLVEPRKSSKIHIIKNFDIINGNINPVTFCSIYYSQLNKRKILDPRFDKIDLDQICHTCQMKYFHFYNKHGDKYPKIIEIDPDPILEAIDVFLLAHKYDNKTAQMLTGITRDKYFDLKKRYKNIYKGIENIFRKNFL